MKEDFGTSDSGYQGLDEADFHWHFGHGLSTNYDLALWDYSPWNPWPTVDSGDVCYKWDSNNEWVVFQSCYVLGDVWWGQALKNSHMLLGYRTSVTADTNVAEKFFEYAVDYDWTVYDAWEQATKLTYGNEVEAVAFVDSLDQKDNDHLWGQGYVAPDDPDTDSVYYYYWNC